MTSSALPVVSVPLALAGSERTLLPYSAAVRNVPELRVAAIFTEETPSRHWLREMGRPAVCYTMEELLSSEHAALIIATPLKLRASLALEALLRGRHVMSAAPPALTPAECDDLTLAAVRTGVVFFSDFPARHNPCFLRVTEAIRNKLPGKIHQVRCHIHYRNDEDEKPQSFADHACRAADVCRMWLGDVETVNADIEVEHRHASGHLIFNHEDGVSVCHVLGGPAAHRSERYHIEGETGEIELISVASRPRSYRLLLHHNNGLEEDLTPPDTTHIHAIQYMTQAFLQAIQAHEDQSRHGADIRKSLESIYAAFIASRYKSRVQLPLLTFQSLEGLLY